MSKKLKNCIALTVVVSFLLLNGARSAHAGNVRCFSRILKELFSKKSIEVIDASDLEKTMGNIRLNQIFEMQVNDELLLGLQPNGHVYLVAGDIRYDAEVFGHYGKIHKNISQINNGTLIRFKDVPKTTVDQIKKNLLAAVEHGDFHSLNCYAGACDQLEKVGIHLSGGTPILPTSYLKKMITQGFVDAKGKPLNIEFYRTDHVPFKAIHKSLAKQEVKTIAVAGGLVAIVGSSVYYFFKSAKK